MGARTFFGVARNEMKGVSMLGMGYIDLFVVVCTWIFVYERGGTDKMCQYDTVELTFLSLLALYRILRVWTSVVSDQPNILHNLMHQMAVRKALSNETYKLVFLTRSAPFAMHLWDELDGLWSKLKDTWGNSATRVSRITIHCTDPDKVACNQLTQKAEGSQLYKDKGLVFRRPDMGLVLQEEMMKHIKNDIAAGSDKPGGSPVLVTFCGSPTLGEHIASKVVNLSAAMKLLSRSRYAHSLHFTQENYGHTTYMQKKKSSGITDQELHIERSKALRREKDLMEQIKSMEEALGRSPRSDSSLKRFSRSNGKRDLDMPNGDSGDAGDEEGPGDFGEVFGGGSGLDKVWHKKVGGAVENMFDRYDWMHQGH